MKLKAAKAELQRRKHHHTTEVRVWLRKIVVDYYQYPAVPGNKMQCASLADAFAGCGGMFCFVAANAQRWDGIVSIPS